jgi:hypothetical protein
MLHIVVGCQLLPTTLKIFTHMDHVHIALILTIVRVIVHPGDNSPIFQMNMNFSSLGFESNSNFYNPD